MIFRFKFNREFSCKYLFKNTSISEFPYVYLPQFVKIVLTFICICIQSFKKIFFLFFANKKYLTRLTVISEICAKDKVIYLSLEILIEQTMINLTKK